MNEMQLSNLGVSQNNVGAKVEQLEVIVGLCSKREDLLSYSMGNI